LAAYTSDGFPVTAIIAAAIGAGVTLAVLLFAISVASSLSRGTQGIVTRFMGLIVASMGMQFVLVGLKAFLK
jgi:small neutral amino acid transporter SnatA (MarC family)